MPYIYFNTEIGQSTNIRDGIRALLQTADIYYRMKNHCSNIYRECNNARSICIVREKNGYKYNTDECIKTIYKDNKNIDKIKLLFHCIDRGKVIEPQCLENLDNWVVEQLGVHSPLMEYAVKKNGMLLTIAVTNDWKCDFFTFSQRDSYKLPNLWGQNDTRLLEKWIDEWYKKHNSPHEELFRHCKNIILCQEALPENDFTSQQWKNIIQRFKQAHKMNYTVDNKLIKNLRQNQTKYGSLYELRLYDDGIRIFFSLQNRNPIVGGYYLYSTGEKVRTKNSKNAVIRINTHN